MTVAGGSKSEVRHGLPEALVCEDGSLVDRPEVWHWRRAAELQALFEANVYGAAPELSPRVSGSVIQDGVAGFAPHVNLSRVELDVGGRLRTELLLALPRAGRPAGCFVGLNFDGIAAVLDSAACLARGIESAWAQAAWPLGEVVSRGYALATFRAADLVADNASEALPLLRRRVGGGLERAPGDAGALSFWAWGISRAVDYLRGRPDLDDVRFAVFGHSRMGKAALLAGARDQRLSVVIAHQSGAGGAAPWRVPEKLALPVAGPAAAETLEAITSRFGYWFCDGLARFRDDPSALPVDQHELIALCAPRPVLLTNATGDHWAYPSGQRQMLEAAAPVYRLLSEPQEAVIGRMPEEGALAGERLGWFVRPGGHCTTVEDWRAWLDYADCWL